MTTDEVLNLAQKMMSNKIMVDGRTYYLAIDVLTFTDALTEIAYRKLDEAKAVQN